MLTGLSYNSYGKYVYINRNFFAFFLYCWGRGVRSWGNIGMNAKRMEYTFLILHFRIQGILSYFMCTRGQIRS